MTNLFITMCSVLIRGLVPLLIPCLCSVHRSYLAWLLIVELALSLGFVLSLSMLSRISLCHSFLHLVFLPGIEALLLWMGVDRIRERAQTLAWGFGESKWGVRA